MGRRDGHAWQRQVARLHHAADIAAGLDIFLRRCRRAFFWLRGLTCLRRRGGGLLSRRRGATYPGQRNPEEQSCDEAERILTARHGPMMFPQVTESLN